MESEGKYTELMVAALATQMGIKVSMPYGGDLRYDQIWDVGSKLLKIQIKKCNLSKNQNSIKFSCQGNHKNYEPGEIDALVTCYQGKLYMIPFEEMNLSSPKQLVFFVNKNTIQNVQNGINWAEDYEIEKQLPKYIDNE